MAHPPEVDDVGRRANERLGLSSFSGSDCAQCARGDNVGEIAHVEDARYALEQFAGGLDEVEDGAGGFTSAPGGVDFDGCLRLAEI